MKSLYRLAFLLSISIYSFGQIPAVSDFTPTSGPVGTSVTITGSNFSTNISDNIVYFGAVKATVTNASSNELTITVPPGATYQPISVTVGGLTAYSAKIFITTFPEGGSIDLNSFGSATSYEPGFDGRMIAVGDLDGDGKSDIAIAGYGPIISIFRNISTSNVISFAPAVNFTIGDFGSDITMGDLDGDGKLDLAITCESLHQLFVFRNASTSGAITTGSFEPKLVFATDIFPHDVSIDDLDGDGKADLAVATQHGKVNVFRNTSTMGSLTTSSFASAVKFTVNLETQAISTRDLDGDGKSEIVTASFGTNTISVLRNTSTPGSIVAGSFAAKVDFATGSYPHKMAIADLDGDNKPDISVLNYNSNTVSVFRNGSTLGSISTSSFSPKVDFTTGEGSSSVTVADVDGDGKPDLCVSASTFSIFRNVSTPGVLAISSFAPKVDFSNTGIVARIAVGDLNNDGKPDLTYVNYKLFILPNIIDTPFLSDFTPSHGDEGTIVTITGNNFDPIASNNTVKFNGTPATVNTATASSIEVTVPAGATTGFITVEVNGLQFRSRSMFMLPPVITSFTPSSGLVGSTVVISGANFDPLPSNNVVAFNGMTATVTNSTPTSITAIVPPGTTSGLITVSVNGLTGTSTSSFGMKQNQSIIFNSIAGTKTLGDLPFTLSATASSGLPVQFSTTSEKVSLTGNHVTLLKPGSVTITANQNGNDIFAAASPLPQTFCINPMKPRITVENGDHGLPILLSSSSTGNQWYHNGYAINGETSSTLNVTESGFYNVKVTIDDCVSQISDDIDLTVTAAENEYKERTIIYPIPAQHRISVELSGFDNGRPIDILIYNTLSQVMERTTAAVDQRKLDLDISKLPKGIYILHAGQEKITRQVKFMKED